MPAELGHVAEYVFTQVTAVSSQRTGSLLNDFVKTADLTINIFAGLITDHQVLEILTQVVAVQTQDPALTVRIFAAPAAALAQRRVNIGDHPADRGLHPGRIRTPAQQDISPILLKLFSNQRRFDAVQGTQQAQGKIIETDSDC